MLTLVIRNTINVEAGDEIELYDINDEKIFGGYVEKKEKSLGVNRLIIYGYDSIFLNKIINEYYLDETPEDIIKNLIDSNTDLTYISTFVSTFKIKKIIFKDTKLIDALNRIFKVLNVTYYVDLNKNFDIFLRKDRINPYSIDTKKDRRLTDWRKDLDKKATKVIVIGQSYLQRTTESITGTGTEFNVLKIPTDLRVVVDGDEKTLNIEDTQQGDYSVDKKNRKIVFNEEVTNPIFEYSYETQIRVELGIEGRDVEISRNYIRDRKEAFELAKRYLDIYNDGIEFCSFSINSTDINSFKPGELISVVDNNVSPEVDSVFIINKVSKEYGRFVTLEIGEYEDELFDWQKETQERIKNLEKKDTDSDFLQKYLYFSLESFFKFNTEITVYFI